MTKGAETNRPRVARLKEWGREVKRDVHAVYLAGRHPGTPWYAKALAAFVAAYALSPIDLIPDFIPVLGLLDDVILLPLGVLLVARLVPPKVMAECRVAAAAVERRPVSRVGMAAVVTAWVAGTTLVGWLLWPTAFGFLSG